MSPNRFTSQLQRVDMDKVRPWLPIAAAAIGGLLLGLIIGWVVWPVQWTNAQVVDLTESQKAAYLSAAADAYVMDGTQSPEVRLQERLAPFGDQLSDEIVAAMAWLREQPAPDTVRLANLAQAATAIGVPVDGSMIAVAGANDSTAALQAAIPDNSANAPLDSASADTSASADSADSAAAAEASAGDQADEGSSSGVGILTWLLAIVAALGLIGGGIYLLLRLSRPRQPSQSMVSPAAPVLPGEPRPVQPVMTSTSVPDKAAQTKTSAWSPDKGQNATTVATGDDLEFDDEMEDDPSSRYQRSTGTIIPMEDDEPITQHYVTQPGTASAPVPSAPASSDVPTSSDKPAPIDKPAWSPVQYGGSTPVAPTTGNSGGTTPVGSLNGSKSGSAVAVAIAQPVAPVAVAPAIAPAPSIAATMQPAIAIGDPSIAIPTTVRPPVKAPARKFISRFQCEYFVGAPDYIEAHTIMDPVSNKFVGECGMSVSKRNRSLHENPDEVIALEVWLYDKLDPKHNASSMRVLLSQYAASHNLAQSFVQDSDASKTVVIKNGTKFQVDGENLVLEGDVISVDYDQNGVFRDVRLAMSILSRK